MISASPKVSVIIPIYNSERYLHQCIDSIIHQTLSDIEIICVDDGSTDVSLNILHEYQYSDDRIIIVTKENAGAGAARNYGLDIARGEYLSFLDSDDFFDPHFLEKIYNRCLCDNADIGIFKYKKYDDISHRCLQMEFGVFEWYLPTTIPFSAKSFPDYLFEMFQLPAWNKLFKREFIIHHNLRFQEIYRSNDLLFTLLSLASAETITVLDEVLLYYRIGIQSNCQSTNYKHPLNFYTALFELKNELCTRDLWRYFEYTYINMALMVCLYNLKTLEGTNSFEHAYTFLRDSGFNNLGFSSHSIGYFHDKWLYWQCVNIQKTPCSDFFRRNLLRRLRFILYALRYFAPQLLDYGLWHLKHKGFRYTFNVIRDQYFI
ncbi:Undecaprenyl-phosphate 4-deoxy-4-formamido-L-arabinose transferase [Methanocorpusculaceae archaeon Sp1]|nr:Undecaprenyl-phosphate 4-deoxy-4-formamido-L-arabinose transferase [Methanocorpusculaceae archaeon Sp1]